MLACETVFLSYSREDFEIAGRVVKLLNDEGITTFWDTEIRNGLNWEAALEEKLKNVKCVLVLWSNTSVSSSWVREEADFGRSRQVLVAANIDGCKLPFGYRVYQTDSLAGWKAGGPPPPNWTNLLDRIKELASEAPSIVDRTGKDEKLRIEQKRTNSAHISVSDHVADRDAVNSQLIPYPEAQGFVTRGYSELQSAQQAARYNLNDRIPPAHYRSAAEHFRQAIESIPDGALVRIARDGRPVEYFLKMELANSLSFSEPSGNERVDPRQEAIEIYSELIRNKRYSKDAPLLFRLGCALIRTSKREDEIAKAIRLLRKARSLVADHTAAEGGTAILTEGVWLRIEIAKQLGLCNYKMSEIPGITRRRRTKCLDDAIIDTRAALEGIASSGDPDDPLTLTELKARGNLIFLLAQRIREGRAQEGDTKDIAVNISELKKDPIWEIAQNQVHIIDDLAVAAVAITDWQTAYEEAERNVENFASLAVSNGLLIEEAAMEARAKEIRYFSKLVLDYQRGTFSD